MFILIMLDSGDTRSAYFEILKVNNKSMYNTFILKLRYMQSC